MNDNLILLFFINIFDDYVNIRAAGLLTNIYSIISLIYLGLYYVNAYWVNILSIYSGIPTFLIGISLMLLRKNI